MAKKEDEITLTIVKSLEREPLDYEEVILLKDIIIAELMSKHGLNDIQASAVYTWLAHEFRRYDKEAKENLEELNEIFSWIKSKFKKGQTSKDINPTEIFNKLNKLEQSHNGHKIFWSDKTDNYLITVI
jgi:ferritin-like metal-binding protein YciE